MVGRSLNPSRVFHWCVALSQDEVDAGGGLELIRCLVVAEEGVPAVVVRVEAEFLELGIFLVLR